MKEQYVGDVNDYSKYALLRALAQEGELKIGVHWMLTPPDGRRDGRKVDYLLKPEQWREHDPVVFDLLKRLVVTEQGRAIVQIEEAALIKGANYFKAFVPDDREERKEVMAQATKDLMGCDLVFFDPDNGLDVPSVPKGRKDSSKYIYRDEVAAVFSHGHSVLFYQHFPREGKLKFTRNILAEVETITGCPNGRAFTTRNVLFVLIAHDWHLSRLDKAVHQISKWPQNFIRQVPDDGNGPL